MLNPEFYNFSDQEGQVPESYEPARFPAPQQNMLHPQQDMLRQLVESAQKQGPDIEVPRIKRSELRSLRSCVQSSDNFVVVINRHIAAVFYEIYAGLAGLFSRSPVKKADECLLHGHVLPKSWVGTYPNCIHCGRQVLSQADVRKTTFPV